MTTKSNVHKDSKICWFQSVKSREDGKARLRIEGIEA